MKRLSKMDSSKCSSDAVSSELKRALFTDAIYYSLNLSKLAYLRLKQDLLTLSQNDYARRNVGGELVPQELVRSIEVSVLSNAWSIIDCAFRLRSLLQQVPDLKQNTPQLQLFYRRTLGVEKLRNTIQHLNQHLPILAQKRVPAWGVMNWVWKPDKDTNFYIFSLAPGVLFDRITPFLNPAGKPFYPPIGLVTLCHVSDICISDLMETSVKEIEQHLNDTLGTKTDKPHQSVFCSVQFTQNQPE